MTIILERDKYILVLGPRKEIGIGCTDSLDHYDKQTALATSPKILWNPMFSSKATEERFF